jgi:hypothetical protein
MLVFTPFLFGLRSGEVTFSCGLSFFELDGERDVLGAEIVRHRTVRVDELRELRVELAISAFRVVPGKTRNDAIELRSPVFRVRQPD